MKDKLEKSGHKRGYYRKQMLLKASLIVFGFFSLCAIPVGLSYRVAEAHAEEYKNTSQVSSSQEDSSESPSEEEKTEIPQDSQEN